MELGARVTLYCRMRDKRYVPVEIRDGVPVPPKSASSYYARFTAEGKCVYKPLGRDLADALATFRSFEIAQEAKRGKLNAHGRDSDLTITRHRRDGDGILAAFEAYGVWIETRIGELENSIAQVTSVVKRLAHTQPNLKAQVESGDIGKRAEKFARSKTNIL